MNPIKRIKDLERFYTNNPATASCYKELTGFFQDYLEDLEQKLRNPKPHKQ